VVVCENKAGGKAACPFQILVELMQLMTQYLQSGWAVLKLEILLVFGMLSASSAPAAPKDNKVAMLELADQSRCLTCFDVDETVRGSAWRDVAKRYCGKLEEEYLLVKKVCEGDCSALGNAIMLSNKRAEDG
jgi:cytochrome c551/c552